MKNQHVVRVMNQAGMVQRTNSGDLVGMYTLNQMAEVLALHDNTVRPVPTVTVDESAVAINTLNQEIAYLKQQCEKSNQQGKLAAQERDAAILQRDELRGENGNLLRDNEALKAQAASAESERDINYRNWQTAQHEVGVATTLYQTTLDERNKINGQWYETSAKLRNLETAFNRNAIAHSNCLREIELFTSQNADLTAAWQDALKMKASFAANYRAAHNEMTRQLHRANDTETEAERLRADVARLAAELAKRGVFVA